MMEIKYHTGICCDKIKELHKEVLLIHRGKIICWFTDGYDGRDGKEIHFCPFCGKKLEVSD